MTDSITFKFTLTEEDFVRASRAHSMSQRRWWIIWAIFFGVWILPLASVALDSAQSGGMLYRILPFLTGVASVALMFVLSWSWQPRRLARGSPFLGVEMEGSASAAGLQTNSSMGLQQAAWRDYERVLETAEHFLLYPAKNRYAPLPKRAFANRESLERFRELIRANVPGAVLQN